MGALLRGRSFACNLPLRKPDMAKSSKSSGTSEGSATIHDQKLDRGEGGELHQVAHGDVPVLTTAQGGPVSDDQNTIKIGPRGPALIEDFHFREKIFHFDHERIPERVVHARGYGAHGFFENYKSLAKYTRADLFQRDGESTPAFVRFSTVAGSKGSFDLARDVRGFAVKLYTKQGNWDHRRQQHPGLLHPGRHKISGPHSFSKGGAGQRISAGAVSAR